MDFQSIQSSALQICGWDTAPTYLFSENVFSNLIYYSHLFPLILSVSFALVLTRLRIGTVFTQRAFYVLIALFSAWVLLDLATWATEKIDAVMFFWSILILADVGIYYISALIAYAQVKGESPSLRMMAYLSIPILPVLALVGTHHNLIGFDLTNCEREAIEGPLWQYVYIIEVLYVAYIAGLMMVQRRRDTRDGRRSSSRYFVGGLVLFLLLFSLGNITGSISLDWSIAQYGIFGMPIMLGFLIYQAGADSEQSNRILVIRLLSVAQIVLVGSLIFIDDIQLTHYTLAISLIPLGVAFLFLERSVRKEIEHRKRIAELAVDLRHINDQQTNLMHFITHQIKGFFTKTRNISAMALEGDFGDVNPELSKMLSVAMDSDERGVALVQELLNATNLKRGTVQYDMRDADLVAIAREAFDSVKFAADAKHLAYEFTAPTAPIGVRCDAVFIKQAVKNVIDNSIKYTPEGKVSVTVRTEGGFGVIDVVDTGIGFSEEDKSELFTEGGRGAGSRKINVESTGYGLYIVKNVIEQHGGRVAASSPGVNQGSVFQIILPLRS